MPKAHKTGMQNAFLLQISDVKSVAIITTEIEFRNLNEWIIWNEHVQHSCEVLKHNCSYTRISSRKHKVFFCTYADILFSQNR